MAPSWFESTWEQSTTTQLMREAIALALDGELPNEMTLAEAAYQAALVPIASLFGNHIKVLRKLSRGGLISAPERSVDVRALLGALNIQPISTTDIADDDSWPGIVFSGCLPATGIGEDRWIARVLARGGIVVSADRTVELPILASGLRVGPRQPWRRARIALRPDLADRLISEPDVCQLVADFFPPIRLTPGHSYLEREQDCDVRVLARDIDGDEPLVVLARIGGGQVLHSVPHWWQGRQPDTTAVGVRPLASVPAFKELGTRFAESQLGGFAAATVMLTCLLSGLAVALHRTGVLLPEASTVVTCDGD